MYSYLQPATPDCSEILQLSMSSEKLIITPEKPQKRRVTGSGIVEVNSLSSRWYFLVTAPYKYLSQADFQAMLDLQLSTSKAKGRAQSFWWKHPDHTPHYVAYFQKKFTWLEYAAGHYSNSGVTLKIVGYGTPAT